ncbi:MAG: zinc ribbon domain-containing protein [Gemmatimonadales bacterium]|nr:zinc ribbon domain-containing protein [Gemmatimonadales bacterium]
MSACPQCRTPVSVAARFCPQCGHALVVGAPAPARTPWIIAGVATLAFMAVTIAFLLRNDPRGAAEAAVPAAPAEPVAPFAGGAGGGGAPPDISNMSPKERFDRLYNRVMQASESGDQATVDRFLPMALASFGQLDSVDVDARYHVAMLRLHTGGTDEAAAQADSILRQHPGHLFGYLIKASVARFRKDEAALAKSRQEFTQRYDAEVKKGLPEYGEHKGSLDRFLAEARGGARPAATP